MVINHLEKLFVTSDAATIVKELEVAHPAAKLVVLAAQAQEAEIGDGTNLVRCPQPARRALRLRRAGSSTLTDVAADRRLRNPVLRRSFRWLASC